ncbi:MAG: phosphate signaling complex protein PhoU [Oligoflexia bacterium]|nr:phosphate signaling complex protein PhoU [Oligoflexia bacterium]
MERHFDAALREAKQLLIGMAGYVETTIDSAMEGLEGRNVAKLRHVYEVEKTVNQDHIAVDDACVKLLALQQPLAADLRLIVAILKINTDLERMADQAVNIAQNSERYISCEPLKPLIDLPMMFREAKLMVREAIDAFVKRDLKLARDVLKRDEQVDLLKTQIFVDVLHHMKASPEKIEQGLSLILIARNVERIGDHATNIAEDVIYAITGEDVRHGSRGAGLKEAFTK